MLARTHPRKWEELGWPELVGNELAAAPEFGSVRVWGCGALGKEMVRDFCSWEHGEHVGMHIRGL